MNKYSWLVGLVNLTVMACGNNPAPCGCPASTITIDSNGEFVKNLTCSGSACDGCSVESWGSQPLPHSFDSASDSDATCIVDPAPPDAGNAARTLAVVENWRDTSPKHVIRSSDLPLFDPPDVSLESKANGFQVSVVLMSIETSLSLRWECEGNVSGDGREVRWQPASRDDALCVAARGPGGIAVATLRARDVLPG